VQLRHQHQHQHDTAMVGLHPSAASLACRPTMMCLSRSATPCWSGICHCTGTCDGYGRAVAGLFGFLGRTHPAPAVHTEPSSSRRPCSLTLSHCARAAATMMHTRRHATATTRHAAATTRRNAHDLAAAGEHAARSRSWGEWRRRARASSRIGAERRPPRMAAAAAAPAAQWWCAPGAWPPALGTSRGHAASDADAWAPPRSSSSSAVSSSSSDAATAGHAGYTAASAAAAPVVCDATAATAAAAGSAAASATTAAASVATASCSATAAGHAAAAAASAATAASSSSWGATASDDAANGSRSPTRCLCWGWGAAPGCQRRTWLCHSWLCRGATWCVSVVHVVGGGAAAGCGLPACACGRWCAVARPPPVLTLSTTHHSPRPFAAGPPTGPPPPQQMLAGAHAGGAAPPGGFPGFPAAQPVPGGFDAYAGQVGGGTPLIAWHMHACVSVCLSACLPVCLPACLSVCLLSVCLSVTIQFTGRRCLPSQLLCCCTAPIPPISAPRVSHVVLLRSAWSSSLSRSCCLLAQVLQRRTSVHSHALLVQSARLQQHRSLHTRLATAALITCVRPSWACLTVLHCACGACGSHVID
jgi:hypothetical protein